MNVGKAWENRLHDEQCNNEFTKPKSKEYIILNYVLNELYSLEDKRHYEDKEISELINYIQKEWLE